MQSVLKLCRDGGDSRLGGPASAIDEGTREAQASGQTVEGKGKPAEATNERDRGWQYCSREQRDRNSRSLFLGYPERSLSQTAQPTAVTNRQRLCYCWSSVDSERTPPSYLAVRPPMDGAALDTVRDQR
jgi:hypothetical protein